MPVDFLSDEQALNYGRFTGLRSDFIKIQSDIPRPAYFAIVKEAHRLGLPVAGAVSV